MVRAKALDVRFLIAACAFGTALWITVSCASAEDETDFRVPNKDASVEARPPGFGGVAGQSFGGTAGQGFGGTAGQGFGGTAGQGFGGTAGMGVGGAGTCNPAFCPNNGMGQPCCMGPDGPCGVDTAGSCQAVPSNDF